VAALETVVERAEGIDRSSDALLPDPSGLLPAAS
jgi:hypothetical protein